ncbi:membrane protein [Mycobacterium phage Funsized]|nr:membrane protein [Mycobacterium phage Funsized]
MTNPWNGPRHTSWASNTVLTFALLVICIVATVVSDVFGEPPNYLVGLLGTAAGAFFAAIGSDKSKRDQDTRDTADRAETKADAALHVAEGEHPERAIQAERDRGLDPPVAGGTP